MATAAAAYVCHPAPPLQANRKKSWDPNNEKDTNGCRVDTCHRAATTAKGIKHHACVECLKVGNNSSDWFSKEQSLVTTARSHM